MKLGLAKLLTSPNFFLLWYVDFVFYFNGFVGYAINYLFNIVGFAMSAGAKDNVGFVFLRFADIDVDEFFVGGNFKDFTAFWNNVGGKLPEFLEHSVAVHNEADVVFG